MTRRICVATGSRADYGPLRPLLARLREEPEADLRLLVSGGHLVAEQGLTIEAIRRDGHPVDEVVTNVLAGDSPHAMAKSFGVAAAGYADALLGLAPDLLVVLGDRYEALAVAAVAALSRIPVAHIAGGQVTRGAVDDSIRHAITKLAHLHFTSTEEFRRRIVQLGEPADRVHVVGSLGLDEVLSRPRPRRAEVLGELGLPDGKPLLLVTYHSVTADPADSAAGLAGLTAALDRFPQATIAFTASNVDSGGAEVNRRLREFVERNPDRSALFPSLGQQGYLDLMMSCDLVLGNSSSALIEAPAVQTPTVNIGRRQEGRPRAASVIDCGTGADEITAAVRRALAPEHERVTATATSPYGDGKAAERIVHHLLREPLDGLLHKEFVDGGVRC
ncbi:UDP-N-acetylglucosamine 2-epimerase (non-hydrolysing)/GDP/UDP-N,N'-diacetylbacillosamine 2-epimerase (hydrolysing) [Amycolatopsis sacchari]|uniref:UDP-N-acetylglucosamine 2-epimerase (Non-hydrolysing)/GDP/UDP-N,N'-diacetylbacillosamine 2-epimerase (Hydrolysing) n=1 Tax=Amycolatopsis sacchari TaxID=115433 RepID=A0A1I3V2S0_9PSEU|nr:UDP-N-acetylglucosamine 2-epimerase [Amycolatopsis sacchari]SFJ88431.1 UDP-N-acetylglucosamine 2-epimerase (non-hydrolysing)/GDP/UDP-N,N'-diacetylbacillosamine 2-epimerase (hydrolysing) [Amycolatopsis sacchari]